MRRNFLRLPLGLAVVGLALALSGCPVTAESRETDGQGPGGLFGNPTGPVIITITGVPAAVGANVWVGLIPSGSVGSVGFSASGTVQHGGQLTVTIPNVPFPGEYRVTTNIGGVTGVLPITVGENPVIPWSSFN